MAGVWTIIRALMDEARDDMALDGYDQRSGSDAFWDETEETIETMAGAIVFAYDEDGNRAQREVRYPADWYERSQRERGDKIIILRTHPKPGVKFFCEECEREHVLVGSQDDAYEGPELWYCCANGLKLGTLGKASFVGDPSDTEIKVVVREIATEVPL